MQENKAQGNKPKAESKTPWLGLLLGGILTVIAVGCGLDILDILVDASTQGLPHD